MIQLPNHEDVFLIATTRFNNETYAINQQYRRKYNIPAIYGICMQIREKYPLNAITFVLEMNNSTNRVEGIGKIRNQLCYQELSTIYKSVHLHEHNMYYYKGNQWISRKILGQMDPELLEIFENILFKKKTHVKRHAGISVVTEKLLVNWLITHPTKTEMALVNLLKRILYVFEQYKSKLLA
jgi:hypothetical protein